MITDGAVVALAPERDGPGIPNTGRPTVPYWDPYGGDVTSPGTQAEQPSYYLASMKFAMGGKGGHVPPCPPEVGSSGGTWDPGQAQ
jgi:hypothetical protein